VGLPYSQPGQIGSFEHGLSGAQATADGNQLRGRQEYAIAEYSGTNPASLAEAPSGLGKWSTTSFTGQPLARLHAKNRALDYIG